MKPEILYYSRGIFVNVFVVFHLFFIKICYFKLFVAYDIDSFDIMIAKGIIYKQKKNGKE